MGSADENTVLAIFETNDVDEFLECSTTLLETMSNDKVTGGRDVVINDSLTSEV